MEGKGKIEIKLKIFYSDTMINYRLSQKLTLLGNGEFNHLTIILTIIIKLKESLVLMHEYNA